MGGFTDETKRPDHGSKSIHQTKGVWLRDNHKRKEIELFIDGRFQASWSAPLEHRKLMSILDCAFNQGIRKGIKQNQQNIKKALDL